MTNLSPEYLAILDRRVRDRFLNANANWTAETLDLAISLKPEVWEEIVARGNRVLPLVRLWLRPPK